jgi:hypothetical protein
MATKTKDNDLNDLLQKYDSFINLKLKPNLKAVLDSRDEIYNTMSD